MMKLLLFVLPLLVSVNDAVAANLDSWGRTERCECPAPDWSNNWDHWLYKSCPGGQELFRLYSIHDNHKEDRRWKFGCRPAPFRFQRYRWTGYVNGWDGNLHHVCENKGVVTGLKGYHDNHHEDRRYAIECGNYYDNDWIDYCIWTDYINGLDGLMDYSVSAGWSLVGLNSYHKNREEDRRWRLNLCKVKQSRRTRHRFQSSNNATYSLPLVAETDSLPEANFLPPVVEHENITDETGEEKSEDTMLEDADYTTDGVMDAVDYTTDGAMEDDVERGTVESDDLDGRKATMKADKGI